MSKPHVFLCQPNSTNKGVSGATFAFALCTAGMCNVTYYPCVTSLLTHNFNLAWCECLNTAKDKGFTHFAMIHSDVIPIPMGRPWLDEMLKILDRVDADLLSVVVPIKNSLGLTSTALEIGDEWRVRRLTMTEIFKRPATFTDSRLLLNTGLWVCRLGAWCDKVCFRQRDCIFKDAEGVRYAATIPEDWDFSRQVRALGKRIFATREITVEHEYDQFHTREPWGDWETDQQAQIKAEPFRVEMVEAMV